MVAHTTLLKISCCDSYCIWHEGKQFCYLFVSGQTFKTLSKLKVGIIYHQEEVHKFKTWTNLVLGHQSVSLFILYFCKYEGNLGKCET